MVEFELSGRTAFKKDNWYVRNPGYTCGKNSNVKRNCLDVDDVVKAGPGLSFIAYPEAIGLLPVCQLFSGMIPQFYPENDVIEP